MAEDRQYLMGNLQKRVVAFWALLAAERAVRQRASSQSRVRRIRPVGGLIYDLESNGDHRVRRGGRLFPSKRW